VQHRLIVVPVIRNAAGACLLIAAIVDTLRRAGLLATVPA
jgi:hypothetical protein